MSVYYVTYDPEVLEAHEAAKQEVADWQARVVAHAKTMGRTAVISDDRGRISYAGWKLNEDDPLDVAAWRDTPFVLEPGSGRNGWTDHLRTRANTKGRRIDKEIKALGAPPDIRRVVCKGIPDTYGLLARPGIEAWRHPERGEGLVLVYDREIAEAHDIHPRWERLLSSEYFAARETEGATA